MLQQGFHYETCLGLNDIRTPQRIWREWKETLITDDACGQQRRKIKEGEGEGEEEEEEEEEIPVTSFFADSYPHITVA